MKKIKLNEQQLQKVITESIQKILKEEREETINNKIVDLLSYLHNMQKPLREIHWNTDEYALHMVTDETIDDVLEWEDSLAETFISDTNNKINIKDTNLQNSYEQLMKDLIELTSTVKNKITDNKSYDNICAVVDEILEKSNQLLYKSKLK